MFIDSRHFYASCILLAHAIERKLQIYLTLICEECEKQYIWNMLWPKGKRNRPSQLTCTNQESDALIIITK